MLRYEGVRQCEMECQSGITRNIFATYNAIETDF